MNFRMIGVTLASVWVGLLMVLEVEALDYLVNQDYHTAEKGEFEVAFWNDINFSDLDNDDTYNSKHQIEFEYGVTDHLQVAYYEVYAWDRTKDWERDEFKVETKLRFAEAGEWPVDIALYTEYKNPDGHRRAKSDEFENKMILSKDFGPWNVVGNFVFEKKINTKSHWGYEYTAGTSYCVTPRTRLGVELKQELGNAGDFGFDRDRKFFVIPGIYTEVMEDVHLLIGPAFGLTRGSDDLQLKSIVEVEF